MSTLINFMYKALYNKYYYKYGWLELKYKIKLL